MNTMEGKMNDSDLSEEQIDALEKSIEKELNESFRSGKRKRYIRFAMAVLGSIPWVGGFLSATAAFNAELDQGKVNELYRQWLEVHQRKMQNLTLTLIEIMGQVDKLGEAAQERLESESYLTLVRQGFRVWDEAATDEKRRLIQNLLGNAAGTQLTSDDLVRLFIEWIERYHEVHFAVIREIYKQPGITRLQIWKAISSEVTRDDSPEADLYRFLIHDLSTGRIIRQQRQVSPTTGQFVKRPKGRSTSRYMKSAFDDVEPYELTQLGEQFVHYTMSEIVPRIGGETLDADEG